MRRVRAGLGGLALAAGLTTTFALSAGAAPPDGATAQARTRRRRRPAERGRGEAARAARGRAQEGARGRGEGPAARRQQGGQGRQHDRAAKGAPAEDQYVELAREKTDKIFVVLAEFGNERHPSYPDQDTDPATPGPTTLRRAAAQRDPGAGPHEGQLDGLAARLQPGSTSRTCTSATGADAESLKTYYEKQSSGRYSVDGQVTDWVKVRYNEARYGRSNGFPCAGNVCSNTWDLIQDAINAWVADQHAAGPDRRADQGRPRVLRRSGTATTTTTTATSTSPTATSTTSRSSTPAATRPTATRTRARTRSGRTAGRRSRTTGRRARRSTRTAARRSAPPACGSRTTRSSPRTAACRVFAHEYGHDLGLPDHYDTAPAARGQRRQLVDADGPEPASAAERPGHRHPRRRPRRVGQAAARLARLRDRRRRARTARSTSARTSTTAPRRRASSSCCRRRRS